MADIVTKEMRSRMMSKIRGKNTSPEILIRHQLFAIGFRYRLHDRALPGKPDLVFAKHRAVIFVNGCFWHGHDCRLFRQPKSNADFWETKIRRNRENDVKNQRLLEARGWRVLNLWECAVRGKRTAEISEVISHIARWLQSEEVSCEIRG